MTDSYAGHVFPGGSDTFDAGQASVPPEQQAPDPAAAPEALLVADLRKSFGATTAVDGVWLRVPAGTFAAIIGPNGAGKTTTLSMISGLLRPDSGQIAVCGVDAEAESRAAKALIGVLPDRFRTFDRLTGRQLLRYYGALRRMPRRAIETRIAELAAAFDLTEALGRTVADYSTGMTKKLMLAGALIHAPRLLVLDEPFESVDPVSSATILRTLEAFVAGGGSVILSSHALDLVERICSQVTIIDSGTVIAQGSVHEVRGDGTLQQRYVDLVGGEEASEGLEWLQPSFD